MARATMPRQGLDGRIVDAVRHHLAARFGHNHDAIIEVVFDARAYAYRVSVKSKSGFQFEHAIDASINSLADSDSVELALQAVIAACECLVFHAVVYAALVDPVERAGYTRVFRKIRRVRWNSFEVTSESVATLDLGHGHRWSVRMSDVRDHTDNLLAMLFMLED